MSLFGGLGLGQRWCNDSILNCSFIQRAIPGNRWKPSSQQQWAANLATPHTPSTRKNQINSPLTPSTLRNSRCNGKSPRWMIYRDFNNVTPGSIFDSPYSKSCRRSARIAGKQKTPVRMKPGSPRTPVSRLESMSRKLVTYM